MVSFKMSIEKNERSIELDSVINDQTLRLVPGTAVRWAGDGPPGVGQTELRA